MPRIWRDAQVLPVWEGTTNVLSLDVLRVINHPKTGQKTLDLYHQRIEGIVNSDLNHSELKQQIGILKEFMQRFGGNKKLCSLYARDIAYSFCRVFGTAMLLEHAHSTGKEEDMEVYRQFVNGDVQSSFVSGDCGKCLVSQSLINLLEDKVSENENGERIQFLKEMGMGSYSKL